MGEFVFRGRVCRRRLRREMSGRCVGVWLSGLLTGAAARRATPS
jgi:hypothetical protein